MGREGAGDGVTTRGAGGFGAPDGTVGIVRGGGVGETEDFGGDPKISSGSLGVGKFGGVFSNIHIKFPIFN